MIKQTHNSSRKSTDKSPISGTNLSGKLSQKQKKRYARQIMLSEIGLEGQYTLGEKRVLIVGAGGLGSSCAAYLAGSGIGHITIVDNDIVNLSNLHRQILFNLKDVGKHKATVLAQKLLIANDSIQVTPIVEKITLNNTTNLTLGYDVVVSCVDNYDTRRILNHSCFINKIPLVDGAVSGFMGTITTIVSRQTPCYQCIFPDKPKFNSEPIAIANPIVGAISSMQAAEVIKLLLNKGKVLKSKVLALDLLHCEFYSVSTKNNPFCPICGKMTENV